MNTRGEGIEDANGWAWEYNPGADWVVGGMKEADLEAVEVIGSALADLAAQGLGPDGRLDDTPDAHRLRTYGVGTLLVWYQVIPYRNRVYINRVNL
ncbi:hypothetical protein ACWDSL_50150 [Streptomyces sp. NPDC000941]